MSNFVYTKAKEAILTGDVNFSTDQFKVLFLSSNYVSDQNNDEFVSDISNYIVYRSEPLTGVVNALGVLDANDIIINNYPGDAFTSIAIYINTGSDATSRLVAYIDDSPGIPFAGVATPITLSIAWNNGPTKIIALIDYDQRTTNTILYGTISPDNSMGIDGDFYINISTNYIYGPKYYNEWPVGVSLVGNNGQGIPVGGNTGDILAKIDGTNYNTEWIPNYTSQVKHQVKAGVQLTKGQAVYITAAAGSNMIAGKASNTSEVTSSKTMGLIDSNLSVNDFGFVITEGLLSGLDTSAAGSAGDPVWLGVDGNLIYGLINKPVAPAHLVFIGIVTRKNQNNGEIFVHIENGFELQEIHNLVLTNLQNQDIISWDSASSKWINQSPLQLVGLSYKSGLPASKTSTGSKGQIAIDETNGYLYICTSSNNWKRIALDSSIFTNVGGFA